MGLEFARAERADLQVMGLAFVPSDTKHLGPLLAGLPLPGSAAAESSGLMLAVSYSPQAGSADSLPSPPEFANYPDHIKKHQA